MQYAPRLGSQALAPSARSDSSNQRGDGAIEALELLSETLLRPWQLGPGGGPPPTWGHHGLPKLPGQRRVPAHRSDGLDTKALERRLAAGRVPKSSTPSPTIRTSPGEPLRGSAPGPWWSWPVAPGFLLVEDMAYRELGFAGERLTSIWSLVPDTVVQVGTFSKTFFPGSGWGGARGQGRGQLILAKQNTDQCAGALGQRLFEEYGGQGFLRSRMPAAGRCMVGDVRSSSSLLRRICPKASPGPGLGEDSLLADPARGCRCRDALREGDGRGGAPAGGPRPTSRRGAEQR